MKKILGLCAIAFAVAGCVNTSSPSATVASAVYSLRENNLKDLDAVLSDDAQEKYAHEEGMKVLLADISAYKKLELGRPALMNETNKYRYYQQNLYGKVENNSQREKVWNMDITCYYWYTRKPERPCNPANNPNCSPFPTPEYEEHEDCRIVALHRAGENPGR